MGSSCSSSSASGTHGALSDVSVSESQTASTPTSAAPQLQPKVATATSQSSSLAHFAALPRDKLLRSFNFRSLRVEMGLPPFEPLTPELRSREYFEIDDPYSTSSRPESLSQTARGKNECAESATTDMPAAASQGSGMRLYAVRERAATPPPSASTREGGASTQLLLARTVPERELLESMADSTSSDVASVDSLI